MKRCTRCGEVKPISDFYSKVYKNRGGRRYPDSACKRCRIAQQTARQRHPSTKAQHDRYRRNSRRLKDTGVTATQYDEAYEHQGGKCAICGASKEVLATDHDHVTGAFRGLLCGTCNRGLGFLGDSVEGLERALAYLRTHEYNAVEVGV